MFASALMVHVLVQLRSKSRGPPLPPSKNEKGGAGTWIELEPKITIGWALYHIYEFFVVEVLV